MNASLQRLFDEKHRLTEKELGELDDRNRRQLVRMAKGTLASPDRTVAMDALVRISPMSARTAIGQIALEPDTPLHIRSAAATQLGRLGGRSAEIKLIESLALEKAPIFRIKVAAALGKTGTSKSFDSLRMMTRQRRVPALRRQAQLSLILISFRDRSGTYKPSLPARHQLLSPRVDFSRSFQAKAASRKLLTGALKDIRLDSYGIELSDQIGFRIECGRNRLAILLHQKLVERDIVAELERPIILGIVTQQAPTDGSWSTRYLLLAWMNHSGRASLAGYRTDGYQALVGSGDPEGDGTFDLTAVADGANTPIQIGGRVSGKKIVFTELVTEGHVIGKRQPTEITALA